MCFLNLEPRKHIALHQIHKIMFFLATPYYPFKKHVIIMISKRYAISAFVYTLKKQG